MSRQRGPPRAKKRCFVPEPRVRAALQMLLQVRPHIGGGLRGVGDGLLRSENLPVVPGDRGSEARKLRRHKTELMPVPLLEGHALHALQVVLRRGSLIIPLRTSRARSRSAAAYS